jgi:hypothetical protein
MRSLRAAVVSVTVLQLLAVAVPAHVAAQDAAAPAKPAAKPKSRPNLISEEEIAAVGGTIDNAYVLVQRLRPSMLRARGASMNMSNDASSSSVDRNEVQVYLDNQSMGGIEGLRNIQVTQIKEIRLLTASDATTLFGTGNAGGAIQVVGKR